MFSRFFTKTYNKLTFEDVQFAIEHKEQFILINTLPTTEQSCLIKTTLYHNEEEPMINKLLQRYGLVEQKIIIYGRNNMDETITTKYDQLTNLGFQMVYIYVGGLFEWLILQDIYGKDEFQTTTYTLDLLKYKPPRIFGGYLLTR